MNRPVPGTTDPAHDPRQGDLLELLEDWTAAPPRSREVRRRGEGESGSRRGRGMRGGAGVDTMGATQRADGGQRWTRQDSATPG